MLGKEGTQFVDARCLDRESGSPCMAAAVDQRSRTFSVASTVARASSGARARKKSVSNMRM